MNCYLCNRQNYEIMSEKQNISENEVRAGAGTPADDPRTRARQHFERGRELWKQGLRAEAMTEYNTALSIDPDSPAAVALDMARNIMDFYDKQRYNP